MAKKTKSIGSNLLIVLLILIILASSGVGIWAWARYQSSIQGQAVAQVARWNFNLVDTDPQTTDVIELAVTRTDNNKTVAEGKVAPGTYGKFEVGIDAQGTETKLNYVISVAFTNKPTNMKFYLDENKSEELVVDNSILIKEGYMSLEDVKEIRTETIYWDWPFETGSTEQEIIENNVKDTEDEGKLITMQITVTGTEVLGKTVSQTSMQVAAPSNGTNYQAGETITIKANFSDDVYAGENKEEITAQTAPVMVIKFDETAIAKVATTSSVNGIALAEETTKTAQFDSVKGNVINYTYTVETGDVGQLVVDSYTGTVYSEEGMSLNVEGMKLSQLQYSRLVDVVQLGDYVNYDASSNGVKTFTSDDCLTGTNVSATISTDTVFNSGAKSQWRVLSVDREKGIVELMSTDPTVQTVKLSGGDGFVNAEDVLNNVGAIYGQGKGATGGRSIKVEDIEQYSNYDKTTYSNDYSSTGKYGGTRNYIGGNFYKEIKDEKGNVIGYETTTTVASSSSPVTMTHTYYTYTAQSYFLNSTIYNMIFKNSTSTGSNKSSYWLASRCVYLNSSRCNFSVRYVDSGIVDDNYVYRSNGDMFSPANRVVPVVSLKSNIQTIGQDESGVWQLKID